MYQNFWFLETVVSWVLEMAVIAGLPAYGGDPFRHPSTVSLAQIESFISFNIDVMRTRFDVDNIVDKDRLSFISSSTTGDGFSRPQPPRTFQFTNSGEI